MADDRRDQCSHRRSGLTLRRIPNYGHGSAKAGYDLIFCSGGDIRRDSPWLIAHDLDQRRESGIMVDSLSAVAKSGGIHD